MVNKKKFAEKLKKIAKLIEACGGDICQCGGECGCGCGSAAAIPMMPPMPVEEPIPPQGVPEEGDQEILDLRNQVLSLFTKYQIEAPQELINEVVGLIEQHEVEEFPEHAAEEPLNHLQGLTSYEGIEDLSPDDHVIMP